MSDGIDCALDCTTRATCIEENGMEFVGIPQEKWEETFAWPVNNKPPYPPLAKPILRGVMS
jgi:hypothetical protein